MNQPAEVSEMLVAITTDLSKYINLINYVQDWYAFANREFVFKMKLSVI